MTPSALKLRAACRVLRAGGVLAYPTEAVWGLGCEPFDREACERLLALKQRDWRKGLIVVAADYAQLEPFLTPLTVAALKPALATWPGPATWLMPASPEVPQWVRGQHDSIAVRVSAHPVVSALCRAYGRAIISTSANLAGHPPASNPIQLRARLGHTLDGILVGNLGSLSRPTPIQDLRTGKLLRP